MDSLVNFLIMRSQGAQKIAKEAKASNNDLTYWHFAVKPIAYATVIDVLKHEEGHINNIYDEIRRLFEKYIKMSCSIRSQREFQENIGYAEVFGEALTLLDS